jgi:hypothetical protein
LLPPFNEFGHLPHGIHTCDIEELVARFGSGSPERVVETQELLEFLVWARKAGVRRVIINGSYATAKSAPNDVDIVVLPGTDYPRSEQACDQQQTRWPFLQVLVATDEVDLEEWSMVDFGTDRNQREKGVVEVIL